MQGTIEDIKNKYRTEDYIFEFRDKQTVKHVLKVFPKLVEKENNQLLLRDNDSSLHEVLAYIAEQKLQIVKFVSVEPTLESMFLEVVEK